MLWKLTLLKTHHQFSTKLFQALALNDIASWEPITYCRTEVKQFNCSINKEFENEEALKGLWSLDYTLVNGSLQFVGRYWSCSRYLDSHQGIDGYLYAYLLEVVHKTLWWVRL